ncbi:Fe-S cluster assembly sulfur transfer protein SufU [Haloplasma contractile]|uniref:NifU-like protein n=1 Tax=Haloplasma contractile SSD-17B TaxID=1033810 RepID=U2DYN2_9MOLU|nr:SUF system NifU family Fe-S cluster assembly protein [Haloplasma contractile]ERJ13357.1 NifU-like protein [Haloplasma contractile SSD-17B]
MSYGNIENLYRQVIMDHYKTPRNKGLKNDDENYINVHIKNPTCGDDITIQVKIKDNIIEDVKHDGTGCSISMSAASVMTETIKGKKTDEALKIMTNYVNMVKGDDFDEELEMGDAMVYQGVSQFPARFKCATIAWKALNKAIEKSKE